MPKKSPCYNLISGVSHDLKSPLHAILGFTDLIKTDIQQLQNLPERTISHLDLVCNIGNDMLELINNMLTTARLNSGQQEIEPLLITHDVLIKRIHELESTFKAEVQSRNIDFSIDYGRLPEVACWDVKSLRYFVMNNLISNALKFVKKDGIVQVYIDTDDDDQVSISVSDNGPGIPVHEREKIFEQFSRSEDIEFSTPGSGLGLYNAHQMIQKHHGHISTSDGLENSGITFTAKLPAMPFEL